MLSRTPIMTAAVVRKELSPAELEHTLATIDIPICPAIVLQVMAEAQRDDPDLRELARSISADVGMAALAIKLANSPLFRRGQPATCVSQALARLGTRNVVCVVVAVALRHAITGISPTVLQQFWTQASSLATAAATIARRQYGITPDLAYTYGLFHDAAIPVLMRRFPEYQDVEYDVIYNARRRDEVEEERLGCNHPQVGALLLRNWGLPAEVREAVRYHHDPEAYRLPESILPETALHLIAIGHVAEHLMAALRSEADLSVGDILYAQALAHLGISETDLDDLYEDLIRALNDSH